MNISFRPANKNDFDFVYKVYTDESVNPFFLYEAMEKEEFKEIFEELLLRDKFLIIENGDNDCGIVTVIVGKARTSHVATIATY